MNRSATSIAVAGLALVATLAVIGATASVGEFPPRPDCNADGSVRREVPVETAGELRAALEAAEPGDLILMLDGTYVGTFVLAASGEPAAPIRLCARGDALIDAEDRRTGYGLHLIGDHWIVSGVRIRNANKGVVLDDAHHVILERLEIFDLGQEAVHFRTHSTDNVLRESWIHDTGQITPRFGEGVYVGSAESNWCRYTECEPDRSDRNLIEGNRIGPRVTAEGVDIKEGTTGGIVRANRFDGAGMVATDSWVDVKGNAWVIVDNDGRASPHDGFQVHVNLEEWGHGTLFANNRTTVSGDGLGFSIHPDARGTIVGCSNSVEGGTGLANVACTPDQ